MPDVQLWKILTECTALENTDRKVVIACFRQLFSFHQYQPVIHIHIYCHYIEMVVKMLFFLLIFERWQNWRYITTRFQTVFSQFLTHFIVILWNYHHSYIFTPKLPLMAASLHIDLLRRIENTVYFHEVLLSNPALNVDKPRVFFLSLTQYIVIIYQYLKEIGILHIFKFFFSCKDVSISR